MGRQQHPSQWAAPLGVTSPTPANPIAINDTKHDQEKDDPNIVEELITKELMELSVQDRNEHQEEVHGVRCLAPKETPEVLRESLDLLQREIDNVIPKHMKQAYLRSQSLRSSTNDNDTYVNTDEFRLRFLRFELFDVPKASMRMVSFLNVAHQFFGDIVLRRPIQLVDFTKQELIMLRKGRYQFLPYRDRGGIAGRRIFCVLPDHEWEAMPPTVRDKILMYLFWVAGNDVDTQREGISVVIWFEKTFEISKMPMVMMKPHLLLTVRPCAIHCCSPDTPLFRFRRSITTMRIGRSNRTRLITHLGDSVELRYNLQSYGIASKQIPVTYGGEIKVSYMKQWVKLRQLIEENDSDTVGFSQQHDNRSASSSNDSIFTSHTEKTSQTSGSDESDTGLQNMASTGCENKNRAETYIDSPFTSDVIFRKGTSLATHPGNTTLQALIMAKAQKELMTAVQNQNNGKEQPKYPKSNSTIRSKYFVPEIISEIRTIGRAKQTSGTGKACRFLVWNDGGWWDELSEEQEIYNRVDYVARGIRNTVIKNHMASIEKKQAIATSTNKSTPTRNSKDTIVVITEAVTVFKSLEPSRAIQTDAVFADLPIQHQNGGTSIFRSQDNSMPLQDMLRCIKKRRLMLLTEGENQNVHHGHNAASPRATTSKDECFGMQFNTTNCWSPL